MIPQSTTLKIQKFRPIENKADLSCTGMVPIPPSEKDLNDPGLVEGKLELKTPKEKGMESNQG